MDIYKILLRWALFFPLPAVHAQHACQPIKQVAPEQVDIAIAESIDQPGKYCLLHDIKSPRLSDIHGEKYASSPILQISSSNVDIDLRTHTLRAKTGGMSGMLLLQNDRQGKLPSHVSIKNGSVLTRTMGGIELAFREGSLLADFMTKYSSDMRFSKKDYEQLQKISADDYPATENMIDTMTIRANTDEKKSTAGLIGIGMRGKGNVVRNSTIEINNGHAAVYLFGPNNVIENNIIIFKGNSAYESAAAIKLHHSDGTIVRNNEIVVHGIPGSASAAAISIIDSKDVLIENNRFYGIKTVTRIWDDKSSTTERNNKIRSLPAAPSVKGEPGVQ